MKKKYLFLVFLSIASLCCESSILEDPTTVISYSLPEPSYVKVTIENSYNTVIATLVDGNKPAGPYQLSYSTSNLLEGLYFYTLEVKGLNSNSYSKQTKPLVVVK